MKRIIPLLAFLLSVNSVSAEYELPELTPGWDEVIKRISKGTTLEELKHEYERGELALNSSVYSMNKNAVFHAIMRDSTEIFDADKSLTNNGRFMLYVLKKKPEKRLFDYMMEMGSESIRHDAEFMLSAVRLEGIDLTMIPKEFRDDPDFIFESKNPSSFRYTGRKASTISSHLSEILKITGPAGAKESTKITFEHPEVAENGAVIGISISSKLDKTTEIILLIPNNPQVFTAKYTLGGNAIPEVKSRYSMSETSDILAIVKANGIYYVAQSNIKTSNGLTPTRVIGVEEKEKPSIRFRTKEKSGKIEFKSIITHPMHSGLQASPTGEKISSNYINEVKVEANGELVMLAEWTGFISPDPYLSFSYAGKKSDLVKLTWKDNIGGGDSLEK